MGPRHQSQFRISLNAVIELQNKLKEHGVQPTAQRIAIANVVLTSDQHPSADEVFEAVNKQEPIVSRATVYNTLNLFADKGLCRALAIKEGHTVYDPHMEPHHHLIDEVDGQVYDLPLDALQVTLNEPIDGFDVTSMEVVVRAHRRSEKT